MWAGSFNQFLTRGNNNKGTVMVAYSLRDRAMEGVGDMATGPRGSDEVWT